MAVSCDSDGIIRTGYEPFTSPNPHIAMQQQQQPHYEITATHKQDAVSLGHWHSNACTSVTHRCVVVCVCLAFACAVAVVWQALQRNDDCHRSYLALVHRNHLHSVTIFAKVPLFVYRNYLFVHGLVSLCRRGIRLSSQRMESPSSRQFVLLCKFHTRLSKMTRIHAVNDGLMQ